MRVLVVGAGQIGGRVIMQLQKNERIDVLTVDPREVPPAVKERIIDHVDYRTSLEIGEIKKVILEVAPDLVLLTTSAVDLGTTSTSGLDMFLDALNQELEASAKVPIVAVARKFQ